MTTAQFRAAMNDRPFNPFVVHMANGRKLDIRRPEIPHLSPGGRVVCVFEHPNAGSFVDLLLMTELEFQDLPAGAQPAGDTPRD
jgi:hypothetical protein